MSDDVDDYLQAAPLTLDVLVDLYRIAFDPPCHSPRLRAAAMRQRGERLRSQDASQADAWENEGGRSIVS